MKGSNQEPKNSRMRIVNSKEQRGSIISPDEYFNLFNKAMKKLACAVDKTMSEDRFLIYFEQLHTYRIEEIQYAVDCAIHDGEFNVIPPVGKLIRYIEQAREEKREHWQDLSALALEYNETWPTMPPEKLRELTKPFYDKLRFVTERDEKERKERWEKSRTKLEDQKRVLQVMDTGKESVEPVQKEVVKEGDFIDG